MEQSSKAGGRGRVAAALAAVALTLQGCGKTHEVDMKYECVRLNDPSTMCMEWKQTGGITEPSCFPGGAVVTTPAGPRRMDEVAIGDELLGLDAGGRPAFSAVRAWLHRDTGAQAWMAAVRSDAGTVVGSPQHLVSTGAEYVFLGELKAGDSLVAANGSFAQVRGVRRTSAKGLYAPLTWSSNYFVGDGARNGSGVLAHSFAHLREPRRFERAFHLALSAAELASPRIHELGGSEAYVHPVASWGMWLAGYPPVEGLLVESTIHVGDGSGATPRQLRLRVNAGGNDNQQQERMLTVIKAVVSMPPFLRG